MNVSETETSALQRAFSDYLRAKNLRHTAERDAIFRKVVHTREMFTLDTVWQQLEEEHFHVSRASVYNTMELLLDAKIVARHQFMNTMVQYELMSHSRGHIYLVCTECNTVRKMPDAALEEGIKRAKTPKFYADDYSLYYYGVCSRCKYCVNNKDIKPKKKSIEKK